MGDRHLKSQIRSDKDKDRLILIALLAIPAVFLWFILTAVLTRSAALTGQLFFGDTNDTFMDFFNCLKSAADRDPYNEVNMVQYPPLCELIFYLIGRMAPEGAVRPG